MEISYDPMHKKQLEPPSTSMSPYELHNLVGQVRRPPGDRGAGYKWNSNCPESRTAMNRWTGQLHCTDSLHRVLSLLLVQLLVHHGTWLAFVPEKNANTACMIRRDWCTLSGPVAVLSTNVCEQIVPCSRRPLNITLAQHWH